MCTGLSFFCRYTMPDPGCYSNKGGTLFFRLGLLNSLSDCHRIIPVLHGKNLEAKGLEPLLHIFCKRKICIPFYCDGIGVIQDDQFSQPPCACQRHDLRRDSLHQAAVSAECKCVMVKDGISISVEHCRHMLFRHGHPHRHAKPGA